MYAVYLEWIQLYLFIYLFSPADQCKNFNDWFSNIKIDLEECFELSETKKSMERKLQKLSVSHMDFSKNSLKLKC